MTDATLLDNATMSNARLAGGALRVVLLQTQAEGAGAQEITRILGRGLRARHYDVHPVFFFRRTAAFDREPNAFFCARERPTGLLSLARMMVALVRCLRALKPDAVLCFQHYGILVGTLAAWFAGARVVIANRTSAKSLVPSWVRALELLFGVIGLHRSVVVNSHAVEQEYDTYPKTYRDRVMRIDHGFEPKATSLTPEQARHALGLPHDVTLLGTVARLHAGKNLGAAIRLLPGREWHLALAGQGPAQAELAALAADLGVGDRVHFLGELPPEHVAQLLRALDVFVFPSLAETFGLAVVEAAQAGIPVVSNDLAVLRETLTLDGEACALFVDANDTPAFAAAVQKLLDEAALAAVLTQRGTHLSTQYSLDAMVERYAHLIETAVRPHHSNAPMRGRGHASRHT
jgi:glycosyltransferase involved in cell wall biosynthesis